MPNQPPESLFRQFDHDCFDFRIGCLGGEIEEAAATQVSPENLGIRKSSTGSGESDGNDFTIFSASTMMRVH